MGWLERWIVRMRGRRLNEFGKERGRGAAREALSFGITARVTGRSSLCTPGKTSTMLPFNRCGTKVGAGGTHAGLSSYE